MEFIPGPKDSLELMNPYIEEKKQQQKPPHSVKVIDKK
jgi:hypothetical protein